MNNLYLKMLVCTALTAFSIGSASAAQWTPSVLVDLVYSYDNGSLFVRFNTTQVDPDSCGNAFYYAVPFDAPNMEKMFAILLTSKSTGTPVKAYLSGCSGAWPVITRLQLL